MSKLTNLIKRIKTKAGVSAIAAALILTPSGVAFAHNGNDNNNRGNRQAQARSWNDNNKQDKRKDDDKRKNHDNENRLACEQRQNRAAEQFNNSKNRVQQRYNGLTLYLDNQRTFVTSNNLSIEKYDELNTKATEAQAKTAEALANAQPPSIDCNKSERKDGEVIYQSIHEMHKSIKAFEDSVQQVSRVITDKIAV